MTWKVNCIAGECHRWKCSRHAHSHTINSIRCDFIGCNDMQYDDDFVCTSNVQTTPPFNLIDLKWCEVAVHFTIFSSNAKEWGSSADHSKAFNYINKCEINRNASNTDAFIVSRTNHGFLYEGDRLDAFTNFIHPFCENGKFILLLRTATSSVASTNFLLEFVSQVGVSSDRTSLSAPTKSNETYTQACSLSMRRNISKVRIQTSCCGRIKKIWKFEAKTHAHAIPSTDSKWCGSVRTAQQEAWFVRTNARTSHTTKYTRKWLSTICA